MALEECHFVVERAAQGLGKPVAPTITVLWLPLALSLPCIPPCSLLPTRGWGTEKYLFE